MEFLLLAKEDKIISFTFGSDRSKMPLRKEYKIRTMTKESEYRGFTINGGRLIIQNTVDNNISFTVKHEGNEHSSPLLWIGNDGGESVSVIDTNSLEVKATVKVGKGHNKSVILLIIQFL